MGACLCLNKNLEWCEICQEYSAKPGKGIPCIHKQSDVWYPRENLMSSNYQDNIPPPYPTPKQKRWWCC
jgi:hypothetical protein